MLRALIDQNPIVWMAEVNGFVVDMREMPRELQVIAYGKGIIPHVPADQNEHPNLAGQMQEARG